MREPGQSRMSVRGVGYVRAKDHKEIVASVQKVGNGGDEVSLSKRSIRLRRAEGKREAARADRDSRQEGATK